MPLERAVANPRQKMFGNVWGKKGENSTLRAENAAHSRMLYVVEVPVQCAVHLLNKQKVPKQKCWSSVEVSPVPCAGTNKGSGCK